MRTPSERSRQQHSTLQGTGAVVAGEVRNLARRCPSAAQRIKEFIEDSVSRFEAGAAGKPRASAWTASSVRSASWAPS